MRATYRIVLGMKAVADIFEDFSGPAELARAIGVSTEHATTMRRRGSIPVRFWPTLIEAARDRGLSVTEADLIAAHAARPRPVKTGVAA